MATEGHSYVVFTPPIPSGMPPGETYLTKGPSLVRVCSWCQAVMGVREAPEMSKTALTHGVCDRCLRALREPAKEAV